MDRVLFQWKSQMYGHLGESLHIMGNFLPLSVIKIKYWSIIKYCMETAQHSVFFSICLVCKYLRHTKKQKYLPFLEKRKK